MTTHSGRTMGSDEAARDEATRDGAAHDEEPPGCFGWLVLMLISSLGGGPVYVPGERQRSPKPDDDDRQAD